MKLVGSNPFHAIFEAAGVTCSGGRRMRMKLIEELTLMVRYAEEISESNGRCTNLNRRGSQLRKDKNT